MGITLRDWEGMGEGGVVIGRVVIGESGDWREDGDVIGEVCDRRKGYMGADKSLRL